MSESATGAVQRRSCRVPGTQPRPVVTSTVLANLLAQLHLDSEPNRLDTSRQLPATFNQFGVRLRASALASAASGA